MFQNNKVVVNGGVQTITYIMLSVIIVLFFALSDIEKDLEFRSTIVFMVVLAVSYLLLIAFSVSPVIGKRFQGKKSQLFFNHDVTIGDMFWIPLGFVASFGFSLLINNIGFDSTTSGLIAVIGSGIIMMMIFLRTGSILIPILIHGTFNSVVILLSTNPFGLQLLSNSAIDIPQIGISLGTLNTLTSEIIFQFFLVAPSEEMFKMLLIAFMLVVTKNKFDNKGIGVYFSALFAVTMWGVYHLIRTIS